MEEDEIQLEIIDFLLKNEDSTKLKVMQNIKRKRNTVSEIFDSMTKSFVVKKNPNHPQTNIYSVDLKSVRMTKDTRSVFSIPNNLNYEQFFRKWKGKNLTPFQKNKIFDTALSSIIPCLNMARIFFWYSLDTNTKAFSLVSKKKLKDMERSIRQVIECVEELDIETSVKIKKYVENQIIISERF